MPTERTPVISSFISSVGYDPETKDLEIEFSNGDSKTYHDVAPGVAEGMMKSSSKGRYFWAVIRDVYDYD